MRIAIAQPHIERLEYPVLHSEDDRDDTLRQLVADELRELEAKKSKAKKSTLPEPRANAVTTEVTSEEAPEPAEQLAN